MDSILARVPPEIVVHHNAFTTYIASQPPHNHRISMSLRKLSQFSMRHFIELSTDIHDELLRRADPMSGVGEHLHARDDIHPKRNHARYQLGDLSSERFGDMCKDLIAEQERRFPEFIDYEIKKDEDAAAAALSDQNAIPQTVYTATVEPTKSYMVEDDEDEDDSADEEEDENENDSDVQYSDYDASTPQVTDPKPANLYADTSYEVGNENINLKNPSNPAPQPFEERSAELNGNTPTVTFASPTQQPSVGSATSANRDVNVSVPRVTIMSPRMSPDVGMDRQSLSPNKDEQIADLIKECTRLEARVTELENDMSDLEAVKSAAVSENNHLHDMLRDAVAENEANLQKITVLEAGAGTAGTEPKDAEDPEKPTYEELVKQLADQQVVTEQVRLEASNFLEEMRTLTEKRSQEDDVQRALLRDLKNEVEDWRAKYSGLAETMRENGGLVAMPPLEAQTQYFDENGKIPEAAVREFRSAVDTLVVEARARPDRLLDLLHNVILTTRRVSREAGEQDVRFNTYTRLISRTANQLISVVRNMSVAGGLLPFLLLDAACSDLGFAVVELFKAARIRPESGSNGLRISMQPIPPETPSKPSQTGAYSADIAPLSSASPGGVLSSPVKVDVPRSIEPPSPEASPAPSPAPQASNTKRAQEFAVPTLPPDSSIAELQTYLEEQTSETVDSIQSLLSGIRDNEKVVELKPKVRQISILVRKMLDATGTSMAQTRNWLLRDKGSFILQNLGDCSSRMDALYDELDRLDDENQAKRQLKQRLAGVSFDMAKSTKELVKTVEEVSIKSEIEQIELQLGSS